MTPEVLKHTSDNKETFKVWIDNNFELQPSNDLLTPLVSEFKKEFPSHDLSGACRDCLLDMVRWALIELKKSEEGIPTKKSKKD